MMQSNRITRHPDYSRERARTWRRNIVFAVTTLLLALLVVLYRAPLLKKSRTLISQWQCVRYSGSNAITYEELPSPLANQADSTDYVFIAREDGTQAAVRSAPACWLR